MAVPLQFRALGRPSAQSGLAPGEPRTPITPGSTQLCNLARGGSNARPNRSRESAPSAARTWPTGHPNSERARVRKLRGNLSPSSLRAIVRAGVSASAGASPSSRPSSSRGYRSYGVRGTHSAGCSRGWGRKADGTDDQARRCKGDDTRQPDAALSLTEKGHGSRPGGARRSAARLRVEGHAGALDAPRRLKQEAQCDRQR